MSQAMVSTVERARSVPLSKIGLIPRDVFFGCISGISDGLCSSLIIQWSAQRAQLREASRRRQPR